MAESKIAPQNQDFAAWYQDVVLEGDMAEPAEIVKGCMVIKVNGRVEGFLPELAMVTIAGGKELEELTLSAPFPRRSSGTSFPSGSGAGAICRC